MVMIKSHDKGTLLDIRVKPRSKKQAIFLNQYVCNVHVKAPPTRDQANQEVLKLFAQKLGIPAHRIQIISGRKSTKKTLLIEGMNVEAVSAALKLV
jgi:uncharacterized protein (TIGR00251 family)